MCVCVCVCVRSHSVLSPRRLRGHALALRHTRLCVSIHPSCRLLATTPGGHRGSSLLTGKHGCLLQLLDININIKCHDVRMRERG